jgi:peroxiredoxin Q/BCP
VEGQVLRDRAAEFDELSAVVVGASFDTPAENRAFAEAQDFGFPLLSDLDRTVGAAYGIGRPAGDKFEEFPLRLSFLIDPEGIVRATYDVTDVAAHADDVLRDLARLRRNT